MGPRSSCHGHYAFPDFLHSVKLKYVKLGYHYLIQHALYLLLILLSLAIAAEMASRARHVGLLALWETTLQYNLVGAIAMAAALVSVATVYFMSRPSPVYMLEFTCYRPQKQDVCSNGEFLQSGAWSCRGRCARGLGWARRRASRLQS